MARPKKPVSMLTGNNYSDSQIEHMKNQEKKVNEDINNTLDFELEFVSAGAKKEFNNMFKALSELNILNNSDKPALCEWCNLNDHIKNLNKSIKKNPNATDIKLKLEIIRVQNVVGNQLGLGLSNKRAILDLMKEQKELEHKQTNSNIFSVDKMLKEMDNI